MLLPPPTPLTTHQRAFFIVVENCKIHIKTKKKELPLHKQSFDLKKRLTFLLPFSILLDETGTHELQISHSRSLDVEKVEREKKNHLPSAWPVACRYL